MTQTSLNFLNNSLINITSMIGLFLLCCLPLSAETPASSQEPVAAVVNGREIRVSTIDRLIKQRPEMAAYLSTEKGSAELGKIRSQLLNNIIDRELLIDAATKAGAIDEGEISKASEAVIARYGGEAQLGKMLEGKGTELKQFKQDLHDDLVIGNFLDKTVVKDIKADEADIRKTFDADPKRFAEGESVRARHVLIKVEKNASKENDEAAKAKIEAIYKEASQPGADFGAIAKSKSECPSAPKGGDLGYFSRGMMVPEFEKSAFDLKAGEISKPVRTDFGYHIIKVEDKKSATEPDYAKAKPLIERELLTKKKVQVVENYVKELKKNAKIDIKLAS